MRFVKFVRNGIKFFITGADLPTDAREIHIDEYEPLIKEAQVKLMNLKAMTPDLEVKHYRDGQGRFALSSQFGEDSIAIKAFPPYVKPVRRTFYKKDAYATKFVPYLRTPNGEGILLCVGGEGFSARRYVKFDPYERTKGCNYEYAPYAYPVTVDNDISPYSVYEELPELQEGERLLQFMLRDDHIKRNIPKDLRGILGGDVTDVTLEEPWFYGRWQGPAYYHKQLTQNQIDNGITEYYLYNAEWWEWNYEGGEQPFTYDYLIDLNPHSQEIDEDPYDNTWEYWGWTSINYGDIVVKAEVMVHSTSVSALVVSQGERYPGTLAWCWAYDGEPDGNWAVIYQYNYIDASWWWWGDPPGTFVGPGVYSNSYTELRYCDSTGLDFLIKSGTGTTGKGGVLKMYEYEGQIVTVFNIYDSSYHTFNRAYYIYNGQVTMTDITSLVDTDGNEYEHPWQQNMLGILALKGKKEEFYETTDGEVPISKETYYANNIGG